MTVGVELSTLAGVVVGAAASYAATAMTERVRWRRQQAVRWDERRLAAYADYARAVKDIVTLTHRLAAHKGLTGDAKPLAPTEENLAVLQDAEEQRSGLMENLRLLTDTDTITAIRELNHCVWHLASLAHSGSPATPGEWGSAFSRYRQARDEYHRLARRTLGIPGVAISRDQSWPPQWRRTLPDTGPDPSTPGDAG